MVVESKKGNCFKVAADMVLDIFMYDCVLVHGVVVGVRGSLKGKRFVHGWIEVNNAIVLDRSNNRNLCIPLSTYYENGQINENEIIRYSFRETRKLVLKHLHYGPWIEFQNTVG